MKSKKHKQLKKIRKLLQKSLTDLATIKIHDMSTKQPSYGRVLQMRKEDVECDLDHAVEFIDDCLFHEKVLSKWE